MSKPPINYDKWQNKTKKKKRRLGRNAPASIKKDIDAGWEYFWSRRKVTSFHLGYWTK